MHWFRPELSIPLERFRTDSAPAGLQPSIAVYVLMRTHRWLKGPIPELSKRQKVFVERLKILCQRAAEEPIPVRIEEVWAFGSFIRLKEKPGDLDLAVKYSERHPLWERFDKEMQEAIHAHRRERGDYPTPADALLAELRRTKSLDDHWEVYAKWAKFTTWGRVDRDWMAGRGFYWDGIAREMLLEGLPRVHIAQMEPTDSKFWLLTEVRVLIWSRVKPDVEKNLASALGSKGLGRNLANEITGFDRQMEPLQFEAKIQRALYETVSSKSVTNAELAPLNSLAKRILPEEDAKRIDRCLQNSQEFLWEEVKKPIDRKALARYLSVPTEELQSLAEKKRVELKALRDEVEVLRNMVGAAVDWIQMPEERRQYLAHYTAQDWVAECALRWAGREAGMETRVRALLRAHGLPESRIVYSKQWREYLLPKDRGQAETVASSNARTDAERKFRAEFGPIVRRFNPRLQIYPVLSDDLQPKSATLFYSVDNTEKGEGWSAELEWLKQHGFETEELPWRTSAKTSLDLASCKDNAEIASLIKEKLSAP